MFSSICAFSMMDVLVKWSENYPVGEVLFFRGFCGLIPIFFLIPKENYKNFYKTEKPKLHIARCLAGLVAIVSVFIALRNLPLATVVSMSFAAPIFTTIMSIYFLSEKIGRYRWLAVLIGFFLLFFVLACHMLQLQSDNYHLRNQYGLSLFIFLFLYLS
jgi:drug/metabolite transporter (DMT)-like permease